MLGLVGCLNCVRAVGLDAARASRASGPTPREAAGTTTQPIAGYERQRRHATLVAATLDLGGRLPVDRLNAVERRHDVEQRDSLDPVGVVERQAMGDAGAAVMAGDHEALVP
jgi:hypothetical protein